MGTAFFVLILEMEFLKIKTRIISNTNLVN